MERDRLRLGRRSLLSLLTVVALALTLAAGVSGAPTRASGTLQLNASFAVKWTAAFTCPPGLPASNSCYAYVGDAIVPGLGHVTERYTKTFDGNRDAPCVRMLPNPVVEVAGKGEIEVSRLGPECSGIPPTRFSFDTTITGGSGTYAGASGSIQVDSHVTGIPGIEGTAIDAWTGTLTVPGLEFDVTPPALKGAVSKTVRAPKNAKRVRVRYTVTAQDAVDGSVPVVCTPRSGTFFKLGRTKVTCAATDKSGNTQQARFAVTVRRRT